MRNYSKIILSVLTILIVFVGGFLTAKLIYNVPTKEILAGYDHPEQEGRIDYPTVITDIEE
ncbi:hypothetical protein RYX56_00785 [Alkalihalophilus lindianensis]|uniref:Uncharacterized protein n=1 Tax=Alkalihalophilus lindianensis TaxID=1630542 RepID=A0ABU3X4T4_9BACI|nr:hypothetical protein [Alkalihalophilus lindianensis]MDV2682900.1 hypothetical protein [Alkalihalophilus lindianensis]